MPAPRPFASRLAVPRAAAPHTVSRRTLLIGAAGLGALGSGLLTACGEDSTAGQAARGGGTPRAGGQLRVVVAGSSAAADVLDPHVIGTSSGGALSKSVWDRLVAYNNDLTLRPRLAETLEPNADGSAWRINLREGVRFSDGRPLTSADVLWSLERMLDPKKPSSGDLSMVDLSATRADGDLGVVVSMKSPLADFGSVLAGWYVYVIQDGTDSFGPDDLPPGTGPFKLESWSPGDRTQLSRNEEYWEDGLPYLDEVEIIQVAETDARLNAFLSDEADLVHELSPVQARQLESDSTVQLVSPEYGGMAAFQVRVDAAPYDDARVREALRLAIDREAIVENVFYGYAEVGNDLYGKGAPFYNDELPQRRYDPERARELLREAGQEDLTVTLWIADASPGMVEAATSYAEQAKAAGITIRLENVPADTYFSEVVGTEPFTYTGWWNYSLDYYYGQTATSTAPDNSTHWRRPAWDQKFRQARATLDEKKRAELYFALQEELWEEGGHIIYAYAKKPNAARQHVQGVLPGVPGTDDWANYTAIWLDA